MRVKQSTALLLLVLTAVVIQAATWWLVLTKDTSPTIEVPPTKIYVIEDRTPRRPA